MYVCLLVVMYICSIPLVRKNGFGRLPEAKLSINQSIINQSIDTIYLTRYIVSMLELAIKIVYSNLPLYRVHY